MEENRKVGALLDVTEHQQRDEDHPGDHQHREQTGLFRRLWGEKKGRSGQVG